MKRKPTIVASTAALRFAALYATGCNKASTKPKTIRLDYAYYNPVSLVLRDKKFLEQDLATDGISVE